jgi:hypothetical protein
MSGVAESIMEIVNDLVYRVLPGSRSDRRPQTQPKPSELPGSNMSPEEVETARRREQQRRNERK